jgi:signal peptidase II
MNFFLPFFIILIDQLSKALVHAKMNIGDSFNVIPFILDFKYITNEGIAFGINFPGGKIFFIIFPILITFYLISLLKSKEFEDNASQIGLFLIIGGAIGNILDRILRGHVIDFIHLRAGDWFPYIFNVADSAVTIGLLFLLYSSIIIKK